MLRDGVPVEVAITPGVSDGRFTEITAGELSRQGDPVIVEQIRGEAVNALAPEPATALIRLRGVSRVYGPARAPRSCARSTASTST